MGYEDVFWQQDYVIGWELGGGLTYDKLARGRKARARLGGGDSWGWFVVVWCLVVRVAFAGMAAGWPILVCFLLVRGLRPFALEAQYPVALFAMSCVFRSSNGAGILHVCQRGKASTCCVGQCTLAGVCLHNCTCASL